MARCGCTDCHRCRSDSPDEDGVGRGRVDDYAAPAERRQHAAFGILADDRDRFGDGELAIAARIEAVDFAPRRGLGDRAGESQAWRGAAARIAIAADRIPLMKTVSVAAALMTMPLPPNVASTPPSVYWQMIEIDLVMVSWP